MFTGIVEEVGTVLALSAGKITIKASKVLEQKALSGSSIAVNGVCLTVAGSSAGSFTADIMPQTLRLTNLGKLSVGSNVNLERAMAADGRFGGHIVSGHIDGTGTVESLTPEGNAVWLTVACSADLLRYILPRGSITIDGVSLTAAEVGDSYFKVSLIPHTRQETTLLNHKVGDVLNLETDIIGKYVERLLKFDNEKQPESGCKKKLSYEFLAENGF